jgi:hypothetical protein
VVSFTKCVSLFYLWVSGFQRTLIIFLLWRLRGLHCQPPPPPLAHGLITCTGLAQSRADECDQEPSPGVAEFCLVLSPTIHTSSVDFLGLAFDLATGLASIGPDLQRKLFESEHLSTTGLSLRNALCAVGCAIYANWVVGRFPLAFFERLLAWLSAAVTSIDELDFNVQLPPAALSELVELSQRTAFATLSRADLHYHTPASINLFSDASDGALAAVYVNGSNVTTAAWTCDRTLSIFAKEALATLMSITLVPRGVSDISCAIDNQGWIWALLKGLP